MNIIEVKDLSFAYNGEEVLKNISFEVKRGDFTGLLGPNGSGKTTLIKLVLGLLKAEKGSIKLFGQEIKDFKDWRKIGYLEQKATPPKLMPLTAFDVARLGLLSTKKMPRIFNAEDNRLTIEIMKQTKCLEYKDKLFSELSGGQQQRVLLARALCAAREMLFLDEPVSGLDPKMAAEMYKLLWDLNRKDGVTIVMVSHDIAAAAACAGKILHMGKNFFFGTKPEYLHSDAWKGFAPACGGMAG